MREGIRPVKYTYGVNMSILTTVESDTPPPFFRLALTAMM